MKKPNLKAVIAAIFAFLCAAATLSAQSYSVTAVLKDSRSGDTLPFATVSISRSGAKDAVAYELSDERGKVTVGSLKAGKYVFKAELLGYKAVEKSFELKAEAPAVNLGDLKMDPDVQQLDAATVSDRGNPIQMKRDTISFTASTYKITDNDMLEDLLKKIPGIEISEDGSITHNGRDISKVTIDGKTFFLDDPQIASKNLPANIIDKIKVVEKKSDQAEFTGIDDGEEETILDLGIKKGMTNMAFGNLMGGGGHDIPSTADVTGDWRWQTAGFLGKFSDDYQLSGVLNANNTNNRGFNDLAGSMMGNIRGGGGGMGRGQGGWGGRNGITTSYMVGTNIGTNLFDDKMELSGNYMFNGTQQAVEENSDKTTHLEDSDLIYKSMGNSVTNTYGHRFGLRMEHKFSDNTSIIFEPRINFGGGSFTDDDSTSTSTHYANAADTVRTNDSMTNNTGSNKNLSTSGFLLFRQKLFMPGQTLTLMGNYSVSLNDLEGNNLSNTTVYNEDGTTDLTNVNQFYTTDQNSYSLSGRATFTQPLWKDFYAEVNYSYNWSKSTSEKNTTDADGNRIDSYSNNITNDFISQQIGANLLYQHDSFRAQLGFEFNPSKTHNSTSSGSSYKVDTTIVRYNWAPTAMVFGEVGENGSLRLFYRGRSSSPSTSQLITVADNSNPLSVSFGNPNLAPYFTHNLRGDARFNNKKTYASLNARINASYSQDPIVNASWYTNGVGYTMPVNGPSSASISGNVFANVPITGTNFTVSNMLRASWSDSYSYVGTGIDTGKYLLDDGSLDYTKFFADYDEIESKLVANRTTTVGFTERFKATYRIDALELSASGRTRMSHSDYQIEQTTSQTTTWNNELEAEGVWTLDRLGLTLKSNLEYHWYRGYTTPQDDEYVFNAEIEKLILHNKATIALKGYDIFGQAKNLTVSDSSNIHTETLNNTLGRYIILSFTYRFGTFNPNQGGHRGGPPHGPGGPRP